MSDKDPLVFIKHIRDSIREIESFTKNVSDERFMKERLIQNAVIRSIEIIGEAVKNLPEDFKKRHVEVEWKKIAGARDKLTHFYFGVDLNIIWDIVKNDIPELKKQIREILR